MPEQYENPNRVQYDKWGPSQFELYRQLTYPKALDLETIAGDLVEALSQAFPERRTWRVMDIGIGPAWLTSRVMRRLVDRGCDVDLVGVDQLNSMLDRCEESFREQFPSMKVRVTNAARELTVPGLPGSFKANLLLGRFPNEVRDFGKRDLCILIYSLHHNLDCWREILAKIKDCLSPEAAVVMVEQIGDAAAWNKCFDGTDLSNQDGADREADRTRLRMLGFLRAYQRACDEIAWNNAKVISASDVRAAISELSAKGMETASRKFYPFVSEFTVGQWLAAGDLDHDPEEFSRAGINRVYSFFPTFEGIESGFARARDFLHFEILHDRIDASLDRYALTRGTRVKMRDMLVVSMLGIGTAPMPAGDEATSGPNLPDRYTGPANSNPAVVRFVQDRFSELRLADRLEQRNVLLSNDLATIWQSGAIRQPRGIVALVWDVARSRWYDDSPLMVKDNAVLTDLVHYWAAVQKYAQGYLISDTIFRGFPELAAIRTVHEAPEFDIRARLLPDGHVSLIEFHLPKGVISATLFSDEPKFEFPQSRRVPGSLRVLTTQLLGEAETLASKLPKDSDEGNAPYDRQKLDSLVAAAREKLARLCEYTGDREWMLGCEEPGSNLTLRNFLLTLLLSRTCGPEIWHLPSRDIILKSQGKTSSGREESGGGLIVFLEKDCFIDYRLLLDCLNLRNRAMSLRQHRERAVEQARKAAETAIISRNMSHNIGSHVLAGLTEKDDQRAIVALLGYLQQRMDFLARLATRWPGWREPVLFWADLLRYFCEQGLLLDRLLSDCSYARANFEFHVHGPEPGAVWQCVQFTMSNGGGKAGVVYSASLSPGGFTDFPVAIPGGAVGRQAFYGLLENMVRNAAKHNERRPKLQIYLDIKRHEESGTYEIHYADDLSVDRRVGSDGTLFEKLGALLGADLIDEETATLNPDAWGLQEMKTYAKFLDYRENRATSDLPLSVVKKTLDGAKDGATGSEYVGYTFRLQRATLAVIAGGDGLTAEIAARQSAQGFEIYPLPWRPDAAPNDPDQFLRRIHERSPGLLVLRLTESSVEEEQALEWLHVHQDQLPARVLLQGGSSELRARLEERRLRGRVMHQPQSEGQLEGDPDALAIALYWAHLRAFAVERGAPGPFHIVLGFDRPQAEELKRWDPLIDSVARWGLTKEIRIYRLHTTDAPLNPASDRELKPGAIRQVTEKSGGFQVAESGGSWFVFDNHGKFRSVLPAGISIRFTQTAGHDPSTETKNNTVFEHLSHPSQNLSGMIYLFQLIESCLSRIFVIDERVGDSFFQLPPNAQLGYKHGRHGAWLQLYRAGIFVCPAIHVQPPSTNPTTPIALFTTPFGGKASGLEGRGILVDAKTAAVELKNYSMEQPRDVDGDPSRRPFDIVVIHWQQLDNMAKATGQLPGTLIESMRVLAPRILITSGRGAPRTEPLNRLPFIEYSSLEQYLIRELSKVSLSNMLWHLKGERGRDSQTSRPSIANSDNSDPNYLQRQQ